MAFGVGEVVKVVLRVDGIAVGPRGTPWMDGQPWAVVGAQVINDDGKTVCYEHRGNVRFAPAADVFASEEEAVAEAGRRNGNGKAEVEGWSRLA